MKYYLYIVSALLAVFLSPLEMKSEDGVLQLTYINPADSSLVKGFSVGEKILFTTSFDDLCGGFNVAIIDKANGNVIYEDFTSDKNDEDCWTLNFWYAVNLQKGHTYHVELTGHEGKSALSQRVGKVRATYFGNGKEEDDDEDDDYEYSDVKYLAFSPSNGSEFTKLELNFLIVDFTGRVSIDQNRSVVIDEDEREYEFQNFISVDGSQASWQLIIPQEILKRSTSHFKVHVYAKDKNGVAVKGNKGKGKNSYYELEYKCQIGYPKVTINPSSGDVLRLDHFEFSFGEGIALGKSGDKMYLMAEDKTRVIQVLNGADLREKESHAYEYTLDEAITEEGTYYLHIPEGVFLLGSKSLENKDTWIEYRVVDRMTLYGVTVSPAEGSVIPELSKIYITFDKWNAASPHYQNSESITVTSEQGDTVCYAKATMDFNRVNYNQCIIQLEHPVSASGQYRVNIPAKAFILDQSGNYYSGAMYLDYTIEEVPLPEPSYLATVELRDDNSLGRINITFDENEFASLMVSGQQISITDTMENEMAKGVLILGQNKNELSVIVSSEYSINSPDDYRFIIPANIVRLDGVVYKKDLPVGFHFDPTSDIQLAGIGNTDDNEWLKVYNLQGQLVREGKASEVLVGLNGLYIVNGKKMFVK